MEDFQHLLMPLGIKCMTYDTSEMKMKKSPPRAQVCLTGLISELLNTRLHLKVFKDFEDLSKGEEHNIIYDLIRTCRDLDKSAKCHKSLYVKVAGVQSEVFCRQSALWEVRRK